MMKKILTVLAVMLLVTSCTPKKVEPVDEDHDGRTYIALLESFEVRKKNVGNTNDDAKFNEFLDKVFTESMESDYMTMHFSVIDYRKYDIEKSPVDLGELNYGFDEENFKYMKEMEVMHKDSYLKK